MPDKSDDPKYIDYMPDFRVLHKATLIYLFHYALFVLVMIFLWMLSSSFLIGAVIGVLIVVNIGLFPYRYIVHNTEKIRKKYIGKYEKLAMQKFWHHYLSFTISLLSASLYFSILLKTDYFLPSIIQLPNHFITESIFPIYIALPFCLVFI
mgnify:FL=1